MESKFGVNGLVKFNLPFPDNDNFLMEKKKLCENKNEFIKITEKAFGEIINNR